LCQCTRVIVRRPVKEEERNHDRVKLQRALIVRERQKHQGDEHGEMDLKYDIHLLLWYMSGKKMR